VLLEQQTGKTRVRPTGTGKTPKAAITLAFVLPNPPAPQNAGPEPVHREIYAALKIPLDIMKAVKI
jgi:hypothetical protein